MAHKASTYDYERAEHTSVTVRSKQEGDDEWRPYVGPEGGTGWTDGDEINYDDNFSPDPEQIDEEATEEFLEQVPEDEREDAREELGISLTEDGANNRTTREEPEVVSRVRDIFQEESSAVSRRIKAGRVLEEVSDLQQRPIIPSLEDKEDQKELMVTLTQAAHDGILGEVEEIGHAAGKKQAAYNFDDKELRINSDVTSEMLEGFDEEFAVGDSIEWLMLHELGHANHHTEIGDIDEADDYLFEGSLTSTRDGEWIGIERLNIAEDKVSEYARTSPCEFVAEVFAGLALGQEFPERIMKMYNEFDGPDSWEDYQ